MTHTSNVVPLSGVTPGCGECKFTRDCMIAEDNSGQRCATPGMRVPPRVVRRGTHIFRMGDRFDALYMVRSGAVKTYVLSEDGDQQVTGFYLPGEVFGLDSIDGGSFASNAVALDTSCVCVLAWEPLSQLSARNSLVQRRIFDRLSRKIRDDDRMILLLGQKSANQRIAAFLLMLSSKQARLGFSPRSVNLPMSRGDIGSYLTLAVETVSRVLTRLQEMGVLVVDRNRVEITDFPELARIAGEQPEQSVAGGRNVGALR